VRVIKLTLEYDGTNYSGWQVQPGRRTIQFELETALKQLTTEDIRPAVSGRTDAGVHALGQTVSFRTSVSHSPFVFLKGLNALLPDDIAVIKSEEVGPDFHARKSAIAKTYRYLVLDRKPKTAVDRNRVWHVYKELNVDVIRESALHLEGTHDFTSFRSSECEAKTTVRELKNIEIYRNNINMLALEFRGTGFLKQMVRSIVGTLVEAGQGLRKPEDFAEILTAKDRKKAGKTAPPQGLYLVSVDY
jgi:tRNA pseudouridine38-40 synthase